MKTRSLRSKRDTPLELVIAASAARPSAWSSSSPGHRRRPTPRSNPCCGSSATSIIIIGSGDDTVETRICLPSGGKSYAVFVAAIPSCD